MVGRGGEGGGAGCLRKRGGGEVRCHPVAAHEVNLAQHVQHVHGVGNVHEFVRRVGDGCGRFAFPVGIGGIARDHKDALYVLVRGIDAGRPDLIGIRVAQDRPFVGVDGPGCGSRGRARNGVGKGIRAGNGDRGVDVVFRLPGTPDVHEVGRGIPMRPGGGHGSGGSSPCDARYGHVSRQGEPSDQQRGVGDRNVRGKGHGARPDLVGATVGPHIARIRGNPLAQRGRLDARGKAREDRIAVQ